MTPLIDLLLRVCVCLFLALIVSGILRLIWEMWK